MGTVSRKREKKEERERDLPFPLLLNINPSPQKTCGGCGDDWGPRDHFRRRLEH